MKVVLEVQETEKGKAFSIYHLRVERAGEETVRIPVANLSELGGGIQLQEWELREGPDGQDVLATYMWISIMGHELDQWSFYDLETGEKLDDLD